MTLFDIIYDFFATYIFSWEQNDILESYVEIFGGRFPVSDWLCTFCTLIIISLIILFFIKVTIWIFKFFGGLFKW